MKTVQHPTFPATLLEVPDAALEDHLEQGWALIGDEGDVVDVPIGPDYDGTVPALQLLVAARGLTVDGKKKADLQAALKKADEDVAAAALLNLEPPVDE